MALGILRTLQKRSKLRFIFTLLSCSGVGTAVSCSLVSALASNNLTASMRSPPQSTLVDSDRAIPWSTTPPGPTLVLDSRIWGTTTSAPGSGKDTPHGSLVCSFGSDTLRIPATVPLPSLFYAPRLFLLGWGIHWVTLNSLSAFGTRSHYPQSIS